MSANENARGQAMLQIGSIVEMVAALECDYDRIDELRTERDDYEAGPTAWAADNAGDAAELLALETAAGECADADDASNRITADPLSVEVRSGWGEVGATMTPEEFRIVLCTGGPHVELMGELERGEPSSVRCIFKDWGESGELFDFDADVALTYCRQFYFGE